LSQQPSKENEIDPKEDEIDRLADKINVTPERYVLEYGSRRFQLNLNKKVAAEYILITAGLMAQESGKDKVIEFINKFGLRVELTHKKGYELMYGPRALVDQPVIILPEDYLRTYHTGIANKGTLVEGPSDEDFIHEVIHLCQDAINPSLKVALVKIHELMILRGGAALGGAKIAKELTESSEISFWCKRFYMLMGAVGGLAAYLGVIKPGLSPDELHAYFEASRFFNNPAFDNLRGRLIEYLEVV